MADSPEFPPASARPGGFSPDGHWMAWMHQLPLGTLVRLRPGGITHHIGITDHALGDLHAIVIEWPDGGAPGRLELPDRLDTVDWKSLDPGRKVEIITAMGFTPIGEDHLPDCPFMADSGNRCNCVPHSTMWGQPADVDEHRGETYEQRRQASIDRSARREAAGR